MEQAVVGAADARDLLVFPRGAGAGWTPGLSREPPGANSAPVQAVGRRRYL